MPLKDVDLNLVNMDEQLKGEMSANQTMRANYVLNKKLEESILFLNASFNVILVWLDGVVA